MNALRRFLSYVEIKTKITSVFPFLMTMAYLFSSGYNIDVLRSIVFFCGMFLFDLTATTINNYSDTKVNHQTLQFTRKKAKAITVLLLLGSIFLGLWLVYLSGIVVLILGAACFIFGVFYSYGPAPISHGPYGEVVSGFFYGAVIPTIMVYINAPEELLTYSLSSQSICVTVNVGPVIGLALLSILPFCLTANIMLANNICDRKHDIRVGRYTLPYYLGKSALDLFSFLYYASYLSVMAMVMMRYLSPLSLLILLTIIPVQKNMNIFRKKQDKEETFILSIKNFIIIFALHCLLIFLGGFMHR